MTACHKIPIPAGALVALWEEGRVTLLRNGGDESRPHLSPLEVHQPDELAIAAQSGSLAEADARREEAALDVLRRVALRFDALAASGEGMALMVVAPPRVLCLLRPLYSRAVREALVGEIERELVDLPDGAIARPSDVRPAAALARHPLATRADSTA